MASINTQNTGVYIGRLTREPVFFDYASGKVVILTVACKRNFKSSKDKDFQSDYVEFRAFASETGGIYSYLHTGDKVGIQYSLQSSTYEDKDGNRRYGFSPVIGQIDILEGKQVREDRRVAKLAEEKAEKKAAAK